MKVTWTNSEGKRCVRSFEFAEDRVLFVEMLYVNHMDKLGKISMKRPTKQEVDTAGAAVLKRYAVTNK